MKSHLVEMPLQIPYYYYYLLLLLLFGRILIEINADNGFLLFYHTLLNFTCKQSRRNVLGKFAVAYGRTRFFNTFKFLKSRIRKCASFSLLRNLTTRLHLNFLPKLRRTIKTSHFVDDRQRLYSNG